MICYLCERFLCLNEKGYNHHSRQHFDYNKTGERVIMHRFVLQYALRALLATAWRASHFIMLEAFRLFLPQRVRCSIGWRTIKVPNGDNLRFHRSRTASNCFQGTPYLEWFTSYSPFLDPTEKQCSKMAYLVGTRRIDSREHLMDSIHWYIQQITAADRQECDKKNLIGGQN